MNDKVFKDLGALSCRVYRYLLWDTDYRILLVDTGGDSGNYRLVRRVYSHPKKPGEMVKVEKTNNEKKF